MQICGFALCGTYLRTTILWWISCPCLSFCKMGTRLWIRRAEQTHLLAKCMWISCACPNFCKMCVNMLWLPSFCKIYVNMLYMPTLFKNLCAWAVHAHPLAKHMWFSCAICMHGLLQNVREYMAVHVLKSFWKM
jgi:hypothetical protein